MQKPLKDDMVLEFYWNRWKHLNKIRSQQQITGNNLEQLRYHCLHIFFTHKITNDHLFLSEKNTFIHIKKVGQTNAEKITLWNLIVLDIIQAIEDWNILNDTCSGLTNWSTHSLKYGI